MVYNNILKFLQKNKTAQKIAPFILILLAAAAVAIIISAAAEDKDYKNDYPQAVVVAEASVTEA